MLRLIYKLCYCSILVTLCFMFTGCEIIETLKKAIRGSYGSPRTISVVVFPPFPFLEKKDDYDDKAKIDKACRFAEIAKEGLLRGVNQFNKASGSTEIIPIITTNGDEIVSFYCDNIFKKIENSKEVKIICRNKIFEIRDETKFTTASCIIFGIFEYKETAEAYNIVLCYYDYAKDNWAEQNGVVSKTQGRIQDNDIENLMKALLHKIYD